jgi:hypothetical protein
MGSLNQRAESTRLQALLEEDLQIRNESKRKQILEQNKQKSKRKKATF